MAKAVILHSWSLNMGDAAMLHTIVRMLRSASDRMSVCAFVSHKDVSSLLMPELEAELVGWPWPIPAVGKRGFSDLAGYPLILSSNIASAVIFRLTGREVFLLNGRFSEPLSRLFHSDLIISPGGDFISPKYIFFTSFSEFLMAKILGKRLIVMAQSIGPFEGFLHPLIAKIFLNLPDRITVRERESAERLKGIGIERVEVTADLAFAFEGRSGSSFEKGHRPLLAVCPKSVPDPEGAYFDWMSRAITRFSDEAGFDIILVPTDNHDLPFQKRLCERLKHKVRSVEGLLSPSDLALRLGNVDFLVSSRMHAILLASVSATPFFAITDSFKFKGVLDELSPGCCQEMSMVDDSTIDIIIGRMADRDALRVGIRSAVDNARTRASRNSELLRADLRSWGLIGDGCG